jgi:hypothetical protein
MVEISWAEMKNFVDSRNLSIQYLDRGNFYVLRAFDGVFTVGTEVKGSDKTDFETNYKASGNQSFSDNSGRPQSRVAYAKKGWSISNHTMVLETSNLTGYSSQSDDESELGCCNLKFYKRSGANWVECSDQTDADSNCEKTVMDFEPSYDYEILGGSLVQQSNPSQEVRFWCTGVPDIPANAGGSKPFITGGYDLRFLGSNELLIDGKSPKFLSYNNTYHTNKLRKTFIHAAGFKHKVQITFQYFRE